MASIRQLANILGVSTSTVSLALRDDPRVLPETRRRIQELAAQYHYHPNRLTQSIISGKSSTLGCILPSVAFQFYARLLRGVLEQALAESYRVIPMVTDWQFGNIHPAIHTLIEQRVDSILIAGFGTEPIPREAVLEMRSHDIVPIALDSTCFESSVDEVSTDEEHLAVTAVGYLCDLGHREIAFVGEMPSKEFVGRPRAIYQALRKHGLSTANMIHYRSGDGAITGTLHRIRRTTPQPTAIICLDDNIAAALLQQAHYQGMHVPRDISIMGCANLDPMEYTIPPLTSIEQQPEEVGRQAVALAMKRLAGGITDEEWHPEKILVPVRLVPRASCARPATTSAHKS